MRILSISLIFLCFLAAPARAERDEARVYAFGNSLVHHLTDSDETTVPHWVSLMALNARKDFRLSGQWGFLRDFARAGPVPNWSFGKVREAWNTGRLPLERAGIDTIWITPANFIQDGPPERPFPEDNAAGATPLSVTTGIIGTMLAKTPDARVMIYEGWPDMAPYARRFPPRPRSLRKYYDYAASDYAAWFDNLAAQVRTARPGTDVTVMPVNRALARWLTGALKGLPTETLYTDSAPHGTANLYFLAALVAYAATFDAPPPARYRPPDSIHPAIRDRYADLAADAWRIVQEARVTQTAMAPAGAAQQEAAAAPAPEPSTPAPKPAPETEQAAPTPAVAAATPTEPPVGARPAQGIANPTLAMGLNGIADWSSQQPFIDVFKTARPWTGHLPGQWGGVEAQTLEDDGHLDAQGWPRRIPEGVTKLETFVLTDMPEEARDLAGRYRLTWRGEGDLRVGGRAENAQYSYSSREVMFDYTPGDGGVSISFSETREDDPIRDITIVREEHLDLHAAGLLFNPDWMARVGDLRMIRFMDWMFTNGSTKQSWDDRARMDDYTWVRRGVPHEAMIRLANVLGADPWFNMPHRADDDYVARFARAVRDGLDPRLRAHVEYSNEMWNFIFPQTQWASERAEALWPDAGEDRWMQYAGGRAAEVAQLWSAIFDGPARTRLVNVIGVHTGWPGLEEPQLEAPLWRARVDGRLPPAAYVDAYAVAGYFGYELGEAENADRIRDWLDTSRIVAEAAAAKLPAGQQAEALARTRDDIAIQLAAADVAQGSLAELTGTLLPYHAEVARGYDLQLLMYEGGTHVTGVGPLVEDAETAAFFARLNYSQQMAELYAMLLNTWRRVGGHSFNAFVDVAVPSKWGSWGALRHLSDTNPRWKVLMDFNTTSPPRWASPRDGAFLHGIIETGSDADDVMSGTPEEDVLIAGPGDDRIVTGGGADRVHGGDGRDTAVLPGSRSDYVISRNESRLVLSRAGVDTWLTDIEVIQFGTEEPVATSSL